MKNVLITGCSRATGFGQLTARYFAENGFKVYAGLRGRERAGALVTWAHSEGLALETLELDVTDPAQNRAAVAAIVEQDGGLDVLINNVGVSSFGALESLHEDAYSQHDGDELLQCARPDPGGSAGDACPRWRAGYLPDLHGGGHGGSR